MQSSLKGISIRGMWGTVPSQREELSDLEAVFDPVTVQKIMEATGIRSRPVCAADQDVLHLMEHAGQKTMSQLDWAADSIDLLVCVTQTPRYRFPGNGILLQNALGISKSCVAYDINLGCSGFVIGLWQVLSQMIGAGLKRALLFVGDATSKTLDSKDQATRPLFGDGAACIALEADLSADPVYFHMGSDGAGAPYLVAPDVLGSDNERSTLFMDGTQVFVFTLREVPHSIAQVLEQSGMTMDELDDVVLHQANGQLIQHLAHKIGATETQVVQALGPLGNTSSASIPLALLHERTDEMCSMSRRMLCSGFGVGWSWGSAVLSMGPLKLAGFDQI